MVWLFFAIIGYLILALVFVLDKFIVSNSSVRPVVYTFYSTIFMFGVLVLFPFVGFGVLSGTDWIWAIISGLTFGFALWAIFIGLQKGEASHITPFNGASITICTLAISIIFLDESFNAIQMLGIFVLVISALLLSSEKTKLHSGFHSGFVWAFVSGLLFAISHVSAKYLYDLYPFWTAFTWSRFFTGFVAFLTLFSPAVWHSFSQKINKSKTAPKKSKRASVPLIVANKILSVLATVILQYAIATGSVTFINALSGLQYAFMFVIIYSMTLFRPQLFKEYFTRREILTEVSAIIFIVVGLYLII